MWCRGFRVRDSVAWSNRGGTFVQLDLWDGAILLRLFDGDRDARLTWQTASRSVVALYPFGGMTMNPPTISRPFGLFQLTSGTGIVFWHRGARSGVVSAQSMLSHWSILTMFFALAPIAGMLVFCLRAMRPLGRPAPLPTTTDLIPPNGMV